MIECIFLFINRFKKSKYFQVRLNPNLIHQWNKLFGFLSTSWTTFVILWCFALILQNIPKGCNNVINIYTVLESSTENQSRIKISILPHPTPNMQIIKSVQENHSPYFSSFRVNTGLEQSKEVRLWHRFSQSGLSLVRSLAAGS